ncbi:MAG: tetratricopeptide repeat protein [Candidatus Thorarchaeota archaeon]
MQKLSIYLYWQSILKDTKYKMLEHNINSYIDNNFYLQSEVDSLFDDEAENLYSIGYDFFTNGNYQKSYQIFSRLTALVPNVGYYWRALGAINQQLGSYSEAITAYEMAISFDPNDVVSYVYMAECKILLGSIDQAIDDLNRVIKMPHLNSNNPWFIRSSFLLKIHKG